MKPLCGRLRECMMVRLRVKAGSGSLWGVDSRPYPEVSAGERPGSGSGSVEEDSGLRRKANGALWVLSRKALEREFRGLI